MLQLGQLFNSEMYTISEPFGKVRISHDILTASFGIIDFSPQNSHLRLQWCFGAVFGKKSVNVVGVKVK